MIFLFDKQTVIYAVECNHQLTSEDNVKLEWLLDGAKRVEGDRMEGKFIGPRKEMITPWSTNAVEITQNMGIEGVSRIEEYIPETEGAKFDPMLNRHYSVLDNDLFKIDIKPEPIVFIDDLEAYNRQEGLALSPTEIDYLKSVAAKLGRGLTDSEVFGFSQVNSEHCRHKIFGGKFIIDGQEKENSLFGMIKNTTKQNPNYVTSAYKDNCAFLQGSTVEQFAPKSGDKPDWFDVKDFESVISIKAETHNFPTTVEPFNGAATGTGGEIRDRIAGGKGAFPIAGTAVYMTSYPRIDDERGWENRVDEREWLYQTPEDILIKASNGASDFGNKFGQPLICGSLLTFEHKENEKTYGYDKVIMMAGGVGYGRKEDSLKEEPEAGDKIVLLGGDNYRIGMGGGAVSSVATGEYAGEIELNAVQRSNPEMQKRVYNAIRAVSEAEENPIISIHDHGAGGHLNCLSELVEATGGTIEMDKLPIGDKTLSAREIIGNESQERMGLVVKEKYVDYIRRIAERERAPMYVVGETTGDMQFTFKQADGQKPIDLQLEDMFGKTPQTIIEDKTVETSYADVEYNKGQVVEYVNDIMRMESVACKDWLTNKVDRSVTGKIAIQQTAGEIQVPINDYAAVALDYQGEKGIATSIGHAPVSAMISPDQGSVLSIAESLTNIVLAPMEHGLKGVSLSANWMWPCKNEGEDARLYKAVAGAEKFALELGINIPTGKDSLSMTQKYKNGESVIAPGTVIITAAGEVSDIKKCVKAALKQQASDIVYVDMSRSAFSLGGSSFAQMTGAVGADTPTIDDAKYFATAFEAVQKLVAEGKVMAGHDISAGGLVTALLEMCYTNNKTGMNLSLDCLGESDIVKLLFSERPSLVLQVTCGESIKQELVAMGVDAQVIGQVTLDRKFNVAASGVEFELLVDALRDEWFKTSYLLDRRQSGTEKAAERYANYKSQPLNYKFPEGFTGSYAGSGIDPKRRTASGVKAAIIREKGVNGDREMAWCMYLAGMDVKDVQMTDLIAGRETLEDVNMIVFVGGFSNSDVLGSAKGWAGSFLFNEKAKAALDNFYARPDTLSLGVCNGCQLMIELGLITPADALKPQMLHNDSHKFESGFVGVSVEPSNSVMLSSLSGSSLGVWIAHGEGKFSFPYEESKYNIALKYNYHGYPANPNGSQFDTAGVCSADGRHLAMMPHLERACKPWNWAYYPENRSADEVTPWIEAFVNARKWIEQNAK